MKNVFVAGHRGMVGSALCRQLQHQSDINLITRSRTELDLLNQAQVSDFFAETQIDEVYLAAAKVGGIYANNTYPADFIYENLMIQSNVISNAHIHDVPKLLFLGSSCIYPKYAEQPITEEALLNGNLEPTNEPYAVAKIAGIKLCESYHRQYGRDYRSVMPTNLYGSNDNFHPENSHVVPALLHKFHLAAQQKKRSVTLWGSGKAYREFMYVEDMAAACLFVMGISDKVFYQSVTPQCSHINVGTGIDCSIQELANTIAQITKFDGEIIWDTSKPDGAPRKLLNVARLKQLGFTASETLETGLTKTYQWFLDNDQQLRS
ncbi:GDP-L-fucose synthase [Alteromonas lipotrueiana]|uniref:GDP-L-fucose synthase n=1 Tax=Alteromonas lipotrueiana TaxID=2803815 RepID=UPI001C45E1E5|nr:GDP-L-fucose synthase [Alteromonas lipotrueiana]